MNLGTGRGKAPLASWTSLVKGFRCGIFTEQTSKKSENAVVPPTPTHKIEYTEFKPVKNYQPNPDPDNH